MAHAHKHVLPGLYPQYTVIAEKFEAIVSLGMANSRMKDYFDLWVLLRNADLEPSILEQAVQATLVRRGAAMPTGIPVGLSDQFASDKSRVALWDAFVGRNKLNADSLVNTVVYLREQFLFAFVEAA